MTKWRFLRRSVFCSLGHTHRKRVGGILACIMNLCLIRSFVQPAWRRVGQQVDKTASSHHRHETTAVLLSRERPARWQWSSQAVSREVSVHNVDGQQGRRHANPSLPAVGEADVRYGVENRFARSCRYCGCARLYTWDGWMVVWVVARREPNGSARGRHVGVRSSLRIIGVP